MSPALRLLALVALLRGRREPLSFDAIRAALGPLGTYGGSLAAARRAFERDKRALQELGLPLRWDAARGGYLIDPAWRRPRAIHLSEGALDAVRQAAGLAAGDPASPVAADARGALERLLFLAQEDAYREPAARVVAHHPELDPPEVHRAVERLVLACRRRLPVACRYRRTYGRRRERRRIDPWGLFVRGGRWYLAGRCHRRDALRIFRVAQLEDLQIEGLPDAPPRFERPADFDLRAEADRSPWDWAVHAPVEALLAADEEVAPLLERLLPARAVGAGPPGTHLLRLRVRNLEALFFLALAWLPRVRPLGPIWLARTWDLRMAAIAAAHAGAPA